MFQSQIKGKAFVLGQNIDTDQIIPASHLVYSMENPEERKLYAQNALCGVPAAQSGLPQGNIPFVAPGEAHTEFAVIVAGNNFGCGSSREHAPFCLREAGALCVVAPSYARIFYRNSVDGGFITPVESEEDLSKVIHTGDEVSVDLDNNRFTHTASGKSYALRPLGDVAEILKAGSVFAYARTKGLMAG